MNVLVVMPTYNERENIERVVEGIVSHAGISVLVVDDASPDGTGDIAETLAARHPGRVHVMHRTGPRGLGLAYIDGLRHALASGADAIGQMDADMSHDPKYLPSLVSALAHSDLAIGSRYLGGVAVVNWPLHRIMLSSFANRYIRAITGLRPRDCTSGFRVWRRDALARLPLDAARGSGYAFLTEMLFEAARSGCRISEVPIVFVERERGYSKVSSGVLTECLAMPWRLIMRKGRVRKAKGT